MTMRIGIVADVHCNHQALQIALERMGPVDELICAGDAVYQFRFSNEVMELLRERQARYVLGNHEEVLLGPWGERARGAPSVRKENLEYMRAQHLELDVRINGRRLLVTHGSPFEPRNEYIYPGDPAIARMDGLGADYVILGHTHYHMAVPVGKTLVINPGSSGEARDHRNGFLLSSAVLETATGEVTFYHFPDPTRTPVDSDLIPRASTTGPKPGAGASPPNVPWWGSV
jgi:putative phosphoesterase